MSTTDSLTLKVCPACFVFLTTSSSLSEEEEDEEQEQQEEEEEEQEQSSEELDFWKTFFSQLSQVTNKHVSAGNV